MGGFGLLNLIPKLPSFANRGLDWMTSSMARNRYASQVRHLRRREYQDMMFSMKKAGLNPILASGATPGHSAAMVQPPSADSGSAGIGSAIAANRQAGAAERGVKTKELKTPAEIATEVMRRYGIASEIAQRGENVELTRAQTAKTMAETQLALQESGSAVIRRLLQQRQAEREGVTAQQIRVLTDQAKRGYNLNPVLVAPYKLESGKAANDAAGRYQFEDRAGRYFNSALEFFREGLQNTTHGD